MVTPIVSSKYRHLYQFCYVKIYSTNHDGDLLLLDNPDRVRSQITSVECQIQRFDFECILVVSRKVIIRIPPVLGRNPLYAGAPYKCLCGGAPYKSPKIAENPSVRPTSDGHSYYHRPYNQVAPALGRNPPSIIIV